jgi:hypothetical protein
LIGVPLALAARDNPGLAEFALITPTPRPGYAPTLLTSVPRSAEHDREKWDIGFPKRSCFSEDRECDNDSALSRKP